MEIIDSCICKSKTIDGSQWVEGYLVKRPSSIQVGDYTPWYIDKPPVDPDDFGGCNPIDISTICKCTGRRDANDRLIFEGDILSVFDENCDEQYKFIVKYGICGGIVNVTHKVGYIGFYLDGYDDETKRCSSLGLRNDILYWLNGYKCYVVGNIYD